MPPEWTIWIRLIFFNTPQSRFRGLLSCQQRPSCVSSRATHRSHCQEVIFPFERNCRPSMTVTLAMGWIWMLLVVTEGCTVIIVTKGASVEGFNMVTQNDDAGGGTVDLRLTPIPAMDWPAGSMRPVYHTQNGYPRFTSNDRGPHYIPKEGETLSKPLGYIPQVPHTYAYWANHYGIMNEKGVAMGESTCGARTVGWPSDVSYGYNMMGIEELSGIGLERCATARCAIQTMGDLAVQYGFWSEDSGDPASPGFGDSAESLGVCDPTECWVFSVLTGPGNASAVWAAQRVPDGHVSIIANSIMIREMDLEDKDNFLASPNVHSFAAAMGWYKPGEEEFDFFKAYGNVDYVTEIDMVTLLSLYSGRRIWRIQSIAAPSLNLDPTLGQSAFPRSYNLSVQAERKFSVDQVHLLQRDYFQGTKYDMSKGIGAGPFESPMRYDSPSHNVKGAWERSVYIFRNMFSHVAVCRDIAGPLAPIFYYGIDNSLSTVYVPFFANQLTVSDCYLNVLESVYDDNSIFWTFNLLSNFIQLRFNEMIKDVKKEQHKLERQGRGFVDDMTAAYLSGHLGKNWQAELTRHQHRFVGHVHHSWKNLSHAMFAKFSNGWITVDETEEGQDCPGYPAWWLQLSDWATFPRDGILPLATLHLLGQHQASAAAVTLPSLAFMMLRVCLLALCMLGLAIAAKHTHSRIKQSQYQSLGCPFSGLALKTLGLGATLSKIVPRNPKYGLVY
eukprot:g48338.t1